MTYTDTLAKLHRSLPKTADALITLATKGDLRAIPLVFRLIELLDPLADLERADSPDAPDHFSEALEEQMQHETPAFAERCVAVVIRAQINARLLRAGLTPKYGPPYGSLDEFGEWAAEQLHSRTAAGKRSSKRP